MAALADDGFALPRAPVAKTPAAELRCEGFPGRPRDGQRLQMSGQRQRNTPPKAPLFGNSQAPGRHTVPQWNCEPTAATGVTPGISQKKAEKREKARR